MPATLSCDEFLDVVREAGIVDEQAISLFVEKWRQASPQSSDAAELADSMFKAGLITSFQKENLLQGKKRGYIIADKYILLEHIGAGGMGSVWLCQHKVMRRRVAIKVLPTNFAKDPEYLARFHRESQAAAALDHPNIVRAFDVDHDEKMHFLVMEYVDGCSFQDMVDGKEPLNIQQAADYISQAAAGLQHAHEAGMVHRDIKPGNLLVDRKGTVKILDMGLALFFQGPGKSLTQQYDANAVLGTAEYLAPEQAIDSHGVDIRADIYSLGLTFFFLLTGKSPYGEEGTTAQKLLWHHLRTPKSVRELRPEVPEGLAAIITRMLAKDRAERYQTPDEVIKALAPWVQGTAEPEPGDGQAASDDGRGTPEAEPGEGQGARSDGRAKKAPPAASLKRGPETVRASAAETVMEEEPTSAEVRAKKKPKSDPHDPDSKRKAGKSDKNTEEPEGRVKTKRKADGSGKQRREKIAAGSFWTKPRLILAGTGSTILVGLAILLVVLFVKERRSSSRPPAGLVQVPTQSPLEDDKSLKELEKNLQPPKKDVEPFKKDKEKPPPPPEKTPPKKDDKTETPKKNPPPQEKKDPPPPAPKESLAAFFPKPGATLYYNVANYATKAVTRQKWEFTDKGVINVSLLQFGMIEKDTLLKNGQVNWLNAFQGKDQVFFRTTKTHIEMGQMIPKTKTILYEPVLALTAGVNDTWKVQLPNGAFKEYAVEKFDTYNGKRAVIIRDSLPVPQGGKIVTHHTYVQGIGEVARSQSLENMPSPPQLLMEAKLVEK